jgi:nuclear transport factor 2 (NTF2) superfamily protein
MGEEKSRANRIAVDRPIPKVALAYAIDSRWRNRSEFINGQMWAFTGNRIAVRFAAH